MLIQSVDRFLFLLLSNPVHTIQLRNGLCTDTISNVWIMLCSFTRSYHLVTDCYERSSAALVLLIDLANGSPLTVLNCLWISEVLVGVVWVTVQFGRDVDVSILYIYRHNFVRTFAKNISVRGGQCGLQ